MPVHIVQIGKHKFICGLFWQSLSRPRELTREAAELAKKIGFDLMILRKDHATAQAGFANTQDGLKRGVFSLAAAVSKSVALDGAYYDGEKQRAHNWLGAFKLPDGKWAYFAVRDANFLPNGDFAGTKDEVLERLHADYGLGGWNAVIGDAELEGYGFHNFNPKRVEDILPHNRGGQIRAHRWWGLVPVQRQIPWAPLAVGSVILLAATGGGLAWYSHHQKEAQEERDRAFEAARRKLLGNSGPAPVIVHPWASKPKPSQLTRACLDRFSYLTAGGWKLDEYTCGNDQVDYAWSRQGSTIDFLLEQVPGAVVDMSGDKASYTQPMPTENGGDDALLARKKLLQPLLSRLQLMGLAPKITVVAPPPASPASPIARLRGNDAPPPTWQTYRFMLAPGGLPPAEVATVLDQPGIRIEKLSYRGGAWSIEGVMYAK